MRMVHDRLGPGGDAAHTDHLHVDIALHGTSDVIASANDYFGHRLNQFARPQIIESGEAI